MRHKDPERSGHLPHADESESLTFIKYSLVVSISDKNSSYSHGKFKKMLSLIDSLASFS